MLLLLSFRKHLWRARSYLLTWISFLNSRGGPFSLADLDRVSNSGRSESAKKLGPVMLFSKVHGLQQAHWLSCSGRRNQTITCRCFSRASVNRNLFYQGRRGPLPRQGFFFFFFMRNSQGQIWRMCMHEYVLSILLSRTQISNKPHSKVQAVLFT